MRIFKFSVKNNFYFPPPHVGNRKRFTSPILTLSESIAHFVKRIASLAKQNSRRNL